MRMHPKPAQRADLPTQMRACRKIVLDDYDTVFHAGHRRISPHPAVKSRHDRRRAPRAAMGIYLRRRRSPREASIPTTSSTSVSGSMTAAGLALTVMNPGAAPVSGNGMP